MHYNVSARSLAGKLFAEINVSDPVHERVRLVDFLVAFIILINFRVTSFSKGRSILRRLPKPVIKLYLYFLKALEVSLMPTKQISIIGGSIWGNRGASAMLETTIGKLREAKLDASYNIFTPYPLKDLSLAADPQLNFFDSRPFAIVQYFLKTLFGWFITRMGEM